CCSICNRASSVSSPTPIASRPRWSPKAGASWIIPNPQEGVVVRHVDPSPTRAPVPRGAALPWRVFVLTVAAILVLPAVSYAQASPWENAVNVLMVSFTGPIARGLSLVSIVVGGVTFAFGEGGSKRLLAGIVFGVGMAIGAVNFMAWLFP